MKKCYVYLLFSCLLLIMPAIAVLFCGCGDREEPREEPEPEAEEIVPEPPLALTYFGQAAFVLDYMAKILMDPYSPSLGYGAIEIKADLVTVSHNHFDHNYVQGGGANAVHLYGVDQDSDDWNEIEHSLAGMNIYTIQTYHDDREGAWLGKNSIFVVEAANLRLAHLGDLGHLPGDEEKERLGSIDILLIPVGGHYTLGPEEALQLIEELAPAVAIPMHYRSEHFPERNLGTLADFLNLDLPFPVIHQGDTVQFEAGALPQSTEIWVMEYRRQPDL